QEGGGGSLNQGFIDVIIRAKGLASHVQRFEGESLGSLANGSTTIVLERGKLVTIETQNLASPIPKDFVMESFFPEFASRVHAMWQPSSRRGQKPDWNMLNVQRVDDTHFAVRVTERTGKFFLAFQHPGWLQFCEFGPFTAGEAMTKGIPLRMPIPAKLHVTFNLQNRPKVLPFQEAKCLVVWIPDDSGSVYLILNKEVVIDEKTPVTIANLGPGKYSAYLWTTPKDESKPGFSEAINVGGFRERATVTLESGQSAELPLVWTPFDPQAYRGTANAEIKVVNTNGTVPAGRTIKVGWYDGLYDATLDVFQGPLPGTGVIRLQGISAAKHRRKAPFGPYSISIDDEPLGFFSLEETKELQHREFSVSPKVGDKAPEIELIAVGSDQRRKLSDYRGKVVLIEFWATGCGPCQPAMQRLSEQSENMPSSWTDKVVLLGLNADHDLEKLRRHIASHGWQGMPQCRSPRKDDEHFSDAEKTYVVHYIPHAIVIDQQGIIRWRGHPADELGKTVDDQISKLLK
ncbi:MAG: thiol-disulfide isomerase-like thioredoxin, partial [Planctomycetaceae bacterium]|nr:thiol-disulfide isomerase-like thioredoxin [Planctomycetaceae bacterium]